MKETKPKQPFYIGLKSAKPFAFAGLWEYWRHDDENPIEPCAILTTESNSLVKPLHDRMPVILHPDVFDRWLAP